MLFCSTQVWEGKHSFYLQLVRASKKRNGSKNMLYLQVSVPVRSAWTVCIRIPTSLGLGNVSALALSGHFCGCGHMVAFLHRLSYKSHSEASSLPLPLLWLFSSLMHDLSKPLCTWGILHCYYWQRATGVFNFCYVCWSEWSRTRDVWNILLRVASLLEGHMKSFLVGTYAAIQAAKAQNSQWFILPLCRMETCKVSQPEKEAWVEFWGEYYFIFWTKKEIKKILPWVKTNVFSPSFLVHLHLFAKFHLI